MLDSGNIYIGTINIIFRKIMKKAILFFAFAIMCCGKPTVNNQAVYGLVIHGGAGTITKEKMTPEKEAEYRGKIMEALTAGYKILERGDPS